MFIQGLLTIDSGEYVEEEPPGRAPRLLTHPSYLQTSLLSEPQYLSISFNIFYLTHPSYLQTS